MRRTAFVIGATVLLVTVLTVGALAGGLGIRRSDGQPCLELTEQQKTALTGLKERFRQRLDEIRQMMRTDSSTDGREAAREAMDDVRVEIRDAMRDVLTPEQLEQLDGRPFFLRGGLAGRHGGAGPWAGRMGGEPCVVLTDEQRVAVAQLREQFHTELVELRRQAQEAGSGFDLMAAVTALRDDFAARIMELLTPEQRDQMEENGCAFFSGRGGEKAELGRMRDRPDMGRRGRMIRGGAMGPAQTSL